MGQSIPSHCKEILNGARTVLLVDWPSEDVPRALIRAGLTVFGYSPHGYSRASVVEQAVPSSDSRSVFPPRSELENGYLVFERLAGPPSRVDVVTIYRPAAEFRGIIESHAVPLRAKVVWLLRPLASEQEKRLAEERGLSLVENCDIAEAARNRDVE